MDNDTHLYLAEVDAAIAALELALRPTPPRCRHIADALEGDLAQAREDIRSLREGGGSALTDASVDAPALGPGLRPKSAREGGGS